MKLNAAQREAVQFFEGPCLVLAGPGSGKTTVIANRAAYLVEHYGVPEEAILVVTFTRAAAEEMRTRYLHLTGKSGTAIAFGTFHSVFFGILRDEYRLGPEAVLKDGDKYRFMEEAIREADPRVHIDRELVTSLLAAVSEIKNLGKKPEEMRTGIREVDFQKVYQSYTERVKNRGLLDFDDMLTLTKALFEKRPEVLKRWQERFRFVMIDEFQDVNPVQYEVAELLAKPENNLFVVGDDDQSIYRFRGAKPDVLLQFPHTFPRTKKILLSENYRSEKAIVESSLALISNNKTRYSKKLRAMKPGGRVEVRAFETESEAYAAIADAVVKELHEGTPPEKLAILFRTNQGMTGVLRQLMDRKVPFFSRDRVPNPFQHFAAMPLFAALNFIGGNRTRLNFIRFMNCPYRYFRREDLREEIVDLPAIAEMLEQTEERRFMAGRVRAFIRELDFMRSLKLPYAMIHYFRNYMGFDRHLEEVAGQRGMEKQELTAVLDEIQASAAPFPTVEAWYEHIAKFTRELKETVKKDRKDLKGRVTVSTLHAAKGLEYDEVWIADVNEGVIPHEKSKGAEEIEEERRLLYVGMTRAAKRLTLCYAKNRFGRESLPSRFLKEIS